MNSFLFIFGVVETKQVSDAQGRLNGIYSMYFVHNDTLRGRGVGNLGPVSI